MLLRLMASLAFVFAVYRSTTFFHHYTPNSVPAFENLAAAMRTDFGTFFPNYTMHSVYSSMRKMLHNIDEWMEHDISGRQK